MTRAEQDRARRCSTLSNPEELCDCNGWSCGRQPWSAAAVTDDDLSRATPPDKSVGVVPVRDGES